MWYYASEEIFSSKYLVRYVLTMIMCSGCQLRGHYELVSVQEPVFVLIRQLQDLVQGGVRHLRRHHEYSHQVH